LGKITSSVDEIALLKNVRRGSQVHIKLKEWNLDSLQVLQ
jgi:hypothetical protein